MRPQAEENLLYAASEGDLATLTRLVEEGLDVNATLEVSAAPACPTPSAPRPPSLPPVAPPSPPPLTALGVTTAPP